MDSSLLSRGLIVPWLGIGSALLCIAAVLASRRCGKLVPHDRQAGPPTPAWQWFCVSNVIAVVVFVASVWYLLSFWMANMRNHSPAYAFGQPLFDLCLLLSTGSMLYLFAFFGVAFVHTDATSQRAEDAGSSTAASRHSPPGAATHATGAAAASQRFNPDVDTDVLIVGAGTAGAALACVLARDGKRVTLIDRNMSQVDRIVGELMQPGGIRALERMGLDNAAKCEEVDCVRVDGYVCIAPATDSSSSSDGGVTSTPSSTATSTSSAVDDLILSYPSDDPSSWSEYMGILPAESSASTLKGEYAGSIDRKKGAACSSSSSSSDSSSSRPTGGPQLQLAPQPRPVRMLPSYRPDTPSDAGNRVTGEIAAVKQQQQQHGAVPVLRTSVAESGRPLPASTSTCFDTHPAGRSFWNHRFVHQLRLSALEEPLCSMHVGTARKLWYGSSTSTAPAAAAGGKTPSISSSDGRPPPPPVFQGYDEAGKPIPHTSPSQVEGVESSSGGVRLRPSPGGAAPTAQSTSDGSSAASNSSATTGGSAATAADDDVDSSIVRGIVWTDEAGNTQSTTARLTVVADGYYSSMRGDLHVNKMETASYFCGLVLAHPQGETVILPYPNRGHVIMADPNPVLLYQISMSETRVLVDVPEATFKELNGTDGGLRGYFLSVIAPQLPSCVRPAFVAAALSQEPMCMPNRRLTAAPTQKQGALLLGDSWNTRHPLTGGGMTVALKDVELVGRALRALDFASCSDADISASIASFQSARAPHAATINVLANALHCVFTRPVDDASGTRARLRAACIAYMALGGAATAGPVGLLAGLTPVPGVLVAHFFSVALFAIKSAVFPLPTPTSLMNAYDLLRVACGIILPFLEAEGSTVLSWRPMLLALDCVFGWRKLLK